MVYFTTTINTNVYSFRVRNDLPGYLSDSEADGVCVINWYHRQFKLAAKERYFKTDADYMYFHSYMSDFFLGRYGGGIPKAFRYTEIQKHRFNLKSKDSEADRQVPAMPLVFYTKEGKISRYEMKICSILSSKYLYILYIIIVSYTI